jgi:hypothetical protein
MPDLLDILLRQVKRPLATYGIDLTAEDITAIVQEIVNRQPPGAKAQQVRDGLARAVRESEAVLARWDFTFQQSLQTAMEDVPGWHTTAEFLEVANEKSNAELRIAVGGALLLALGDDTFADYLRFLVANPALDEVSAVMARRVLEFAGA